jgi:hypothetical protein
MRMLALSVVAAAGLSASVTAAAELKVGAEKTASQSNPWDVAFGVEFMTDYNWRGITVSARRPSVEAYVEPRYRPAADLELYAGVSGANVDLPNGSRAQIVYYAGTRPTFGPLLLDLGGWYIDYPGGAIFTGIGSADTCTNGAFFFGQCNTIKAVVSYFEAYAKAVLTINETLAVGGNLYYAPIPCGNTSRARSGKIRVKASAIGKLIMRTLGFWSNDLTAVASGAPMIHTASTWPSFIASTAAVPAKGKNVAVSEFTPPLPRTCSAEARVPLPSGPTAMRFPLSCDSRSNRSFEE